MTLPDPADEDAWVLALIEARDEHAVIEAVNEALAARRLALAARLVQLLPDDAESGDPGIERARRAAGLVLHRRNAPDPVDATELEEAWRALREYRLSRLRLRERRGLDPFRRHDPWGRRRR